MASKSNFFEPPPVDKHPLMAFCHFKTTNKPEPHHMGLQASHRKSDGLVIMIGEPESCVSQLDSVRISLLEKNVPDYPYVRSNHL